MTLKLNGSSSGYTAIDAPAAAGSNTLVLPTNNGTAGQILQTDGNGNLTWVDKPRGITAAEQWRKLAAETASGDTDILDWERVDTTGQGSIGTGISESGGAFTFPSTGIWLAQCWCVCYYDGGAQNSAQLEVQVSTDSGSNWTRQAMCYDSIPDATSNTNSHLYVDTMLDITNASTFRLKITVGGASNFVWRGNSGHNQNGITFIRLGDT